MVLADPARSSNHVALEDRGTCHGKEKPQSVGGCAKTWGQNALCTLKFS